MGLLDKALGKVLSSSIIIPSDAELAKGWKRLPTSAAARAPKSVSWDPMSLVYSLGYKDRRSNLTYDILRQMVGSLSILSAIVNTRVNQVATFTSPYRRTRNIGFEIKHKDRDHKLSKSEKRFMVELETYISNCGKPDENKYAKRPRDNFEQFTRKVIRDRMTYDQLTFEIVPDRRGLPYEFVAVDASTIRVAADPSAENHRNRKKESKELRDFLENYSGSALAYPVIQDSNKRSAASFVQVWQGSIVRAYKRSELAFCISNPRTDIRSNGYGYAETEQLVNIITSHLWAEEYNRNFFKQGAAPKGLLNIRGDNIAPEQLEAFKRQWVANVAGAENAWRTPIMQSEEIQYLNLQTTNLDMEYSRWLEYLIKVICAVYLIAPEEIGFYLSPGGMQQPMFDSNNEWKLKASKDRGLRPLLRFYADSINRNIIDKLDDHFYLDFIGLDELTEKERIELRNQQVQYFRTVNEIRSDEDLSPIDDGDIILNPIFLQKIQMEHTWKMEEQQRKDNKKMQDEQAEMQKKQMAMQEQAQQEQANAQQQQVAMQQQQMGAGGEGAPAEEGPAEAPAPDEAQQSAPPEEAQQSAPPEEAQQSAPPEDVAEAPPEGGVPEEAALPPEGESPVIQEEQQAAPAKSKKEQLQELLNSLPPEMLVNNTKRVGEE
tara:strand:+ start:31 stop:2010 length:1980 start_codon:yes stop_codon:yes gene_type:complete